MNREELAQYVKDMQDGLVASRGSITGRIWSEWEVKFFDQLQDIKLELKE